MKQVNQNIAKAPAVPVNTKAKKPTVSVMLNLRTGRENPHKTWAIVVRSIDVTQRSNHALDGFRIPWKGDDLTAETLLFVGGSCGSDQKHSYTAVLLLVKQGASFNFQHGREWLSGTNVEQLATSNDPIDRDAAIKRFPQLKNYRNEANLAIFVKLLELGLRQVTRRAATRQTQPPTK